MWKGKSYYHDQTSKAINDPNLIEDGEVNLLSPYSCEETLRLRSHIRNRYRQSLSTPIDAFSPQSMLDRIVQYSSRPRTQALPYVDCVATPAPS